ncbi:hypothetical protein [Solicola sp. PLA-1-18]|uniref:hypothetical protein n=1 Tax=Solicola sp. PLA-1-18 TaxID=3380532 RepID=UPI003B7CE654
MTSPAYDERLLADVGRPLVGIDVDGVLNALGDDLDPELYRTHRVLLYRIQLRADLLAVVQPLLDVAAVGGCDLFWASMWEGAAAWELAPLVGFGADWPHLPFTRPDDRSTVEERRAYQDRVHAFAAEGVYFKSPYVGDLAAAARRPIVWVDDEVGVDDERYFASRDDVPAPVRCVATDGRTGIGPREVAEVVRLVELLASP